MPILIVPDFLALSRTLPPPACEVREQAPRSAGPPTAIAVTTAERLKNVLRVHTSSAMNPSTPYVACSFACVTVRFVIWGTNLCELARSGQPGGGATVMFAGAAVAAVVPVRRRCLADRWGRERRGGWSWLVVTGR